MLLVAVYVVSCGSVQQTRSCFLSYIHTGIYGEGELRASVPAWEEEAINFGTHVHKNILHVPGPYLEKVVWGGETYV